MWSQKPLSVITKKKKKSRKKTLIWVLKKDPKNKEYKSILKLFNSKNLMTQKYTRVNSDLEKEMMAIQITRVRLSYNRLEEKKGGSERGRWKEHYLSSLPLA